jgi:hypothetical protein
MLRRGASPNTHPVRSCLFFRGDWRPHFREFDKKELEFFLQYCGFDIINMNILSENKVIFILDIMEKYMRSPDILG